MKLLRIPRRAVMPPEMAEALELAQSGSGNRLLAWSSLVGGGAAAATVKELRIFTPRGQKFFRPWFEVDRAVWENNTGMLVIWWVDSRRTTALEILDDVGRLPEVVRERIQSSVVLTSSVSLPNGQLGRVALRRGVGGALLAQSLVPPGVKAEAPDVAPVLAAAVESLWAEAGGQALNEPSIPRL